MFDIDKKNLKKLVDAGVRFGFGTDSGGAPDRYFIQGYFEHRQMELMRDAGLTPMQIIQSFSKNNAEMLGIDKDFGTLAKGKAADLLVLAAIRSTTSPTCAASRRSISAARNSNRERHHETFHDWRLLMAASLRIRPGFRCWRNAQTAPKFAVDATWPKDLPEDWITGRLGGVCMDAAQDNVYVVNRRDITDEEKETSISAPSIIKFNAAGDVVGVLGRPDHGARLDPRLLRRLDRQVWVAGNGDAIDPEIRSGRKAAAADRHARQVRFGRRHAARQGQQFGAETSSTCLPAS